MSTKAVLGLRAGQMVVVYGGMLHAGAAYESYNTRVHLYLDVPGITGGYDHYWAPPSACA